MSVLRELTLTSMTRSRWYEAWVKELLDLADASKPFLHSFWVSSPAHRDGVAKPYNSVLLVHSRLELTDLTVVTDNTHLNRWLSQIMFPLTTSLRVDRALRAFVAESQAIE